MSDIDETLLVPGTAAYIGNTPSGVRELLRRQQELGETPAPEIPLPSVEQTINNAGQTHGVRDMFDENGMIINNPFPGLEAHVQHFEFGLNGVIPTRLSQLENDLYIITDRYYVHTDENFTSEYKAKLDNTITRAEYNTVLGKANQNEQDIFDLSHNAIVKNAESQTITGDLHITGNLYQTGETYITQAETVKSTKDYIYLREGNPNGLGYYEYAGFEFHNYNGRDDGRLVIDRSGFARVGDVGDEQILATREDNPDNNKFFTWNASRFRLETRDILPSDINTNNYSPIRDQDFATLGKVKAMVNYIIVNTLNDRNDLSAYNGLRVFVKATGKEYKYNNGWTCVDDFTANLSTQISTNTTNIANKIDKTDIADNLSTNNSNKVLSARQGYVLNGAKINYTDVVDNLTTNSLMPLSAKQGRELENKKLDKSDVYDGIDYSSTNKALSARMGKYLNEIKLDKSSIINNLSSLDTDKPLAAAQGYALYSSKQDKIDYSLITTSKTIPGAINELKTQLGGFEIADNLLTNDATKVLSARQGYLLNRAKIDYADIIDNLNSERADKVLSAKQGHLLDVLKLNHTDLVDNLITDDATKVLSAKQGKNLQDTKQDKSDNNLETTTKTIVGAINELNTNQDSFVKKNSTASQYIVSPLEITGNSTIHGTTTFDGSIHITGDIIQSGNIYETHAEHIYTKQDYIYLRENATTGLGSGEYVGIEATKYDGTNDGRLVFDSTGTARVGDVGSEQPLATRAESNLMQDGTLVVWDATNNRLITNPNAGHQHSNKAILDQITAPFTTELAAFINNPDNFGKIDDVKVNNVSVVSNKIANITMPTSVTDLSDGGDYLTKEDVIALFGFTNQKLEEILGV